MKQAWKRPWRRALSLLVCLALALGLLPGLALAEEGAESVPTEGYYVSVTPSATTATAGDVVTLTIRAYSDGKEVTDLTAAGLNLTTWLDYYAANGHEDGNSDAGISDEHGLTTEVTLPTAGTYYLVTELYDASWTKLATATTTITVTAAAVDEDIPTEGYHVSVAPSATTATAGDTVTLTIRAYSDGEEVTDLTAAGLNLTTWLDYYAANGHEDGNSDAGISDEHGLTTEVTLPTAGTYYLVTDLYDASWTKLASATATITVTAAASGEDAPDPVEASIDVTRVSGLSDDFIMGMDISSVVSEYASGVKFYDFDGKELSTVTDFCQFLAQCGVTHVRVRVWNDPYDTSDNGYGGGNNDLAAAVEIAKACQAAGLKLLVDFHCSDFWCDPGKQQAPKAWAGYTVEEKATALQAFLTASLTQIKATGVEIAMVQVGNETNSGFIGENNIADMCALFNAGAKAVRDFNSQNSTNIKVVIHVTNPEKNTMTTWAKQLSENTVDYDILATSYYPSWHGTFANLTSQLKEVQTTYGKDVMVAETSYPFTLADTDGHDNTVREGSNDEMMCEKQYPFSVQGQASYLRDLIQTVSDADGLGVYYWESAWITVGDTTGLTGADLTEKINANRALWEKHGSGWASSYAAEYDPSDAGRWYGGSAVDNQAQFAADGSPLDSINVWQYVRTGAVSRYVTLEAVEAPAQTIEAGENYTLPGTVAVTYNKGTEDEAVAWDQADVSRIDPNTPGTYTVSGTVTLDPNFDGGTYQGAQTAAVTFTLTVKATNLIDAADSGFENGYDNFDGLAPKPSKGNDVSIHTEDTREGQYAMHWYQSDATTATVTYLGLNQSGITLEPGTYTFTCEAQGYAGDTVTLSVVPHGSDTALAAGTATALTGWAGWQAPAVSFTLAEETTIDLRMTISIQDGGWGTIDCLYLYQTAGAAAPEEPAPDTPDTPEEPDPFPEQPSWPSVPVAPSAPSTGAGVTTETSTAPDGTVTTVVTNTATGIVTTTVETPDGVRVVTVDAPGQAVTATVTIPAGVVSATVTIPMRDAAPGTVAVLVGADGSETVVRKSVAGEAGVTLTLTGSAQLKLVDNSAAFADVSPDSWMADAVAFVSSRELFSGTAAGIFAPGAAMTRGMMAQVLYELESAPDVDLTAAFDDVSEDDWFAEAVAWASAAGVIEGYQDGTFAPRAAISREELAVMLWRYAGAPGAAGNLLVYSDGGEVASWAETAMLWATQNGVINGHDDGTLDPKGTATRAQTAQMIWNFMNSL